MRTAVPETSSCGPLWIIVARRSLPRLAWQARQFDCHIARPCFGLSFPRRCSIMGISALHRESAANNPSNRSVQQAVLASRCDFRYVQSQFPIPCAPKASQCEIEHKLHLDPEGSPNYMLWNCIWELRVLMMIHLEQRIPNCARPLRYPPIHVFRLRYHELLVG